jgi:hypothetical protein
MPYQSRPNTSKNRSKSSPQTNKPSKFGQKGSRDFQKTENFTPRFGTQAPKRTGKFRKVYKNDRRNQDNFVEGAKSSVAFQKNDKKDFVKPKFGKISPSEKQENYSGDGEEKRRRSNKNTWQTGRIIEKRLAGKDVGKFVKSSGQKSGGKYEQLDSRKTKKIRNTHSKKQIEITESVETEQNLETGNKKVFPKNSTNFSPRFKNDKSFSKNPRREKIGSETGKFHKNIQKLGDKKFHKNREMEDLEKEFDLEDGLKNEFQNENGDVKLLQKSLRQSLKIIAKNAKNQTVQSKMENYDSAMAMEINPQKYENTKTDEAKRAHKNALKIKKLLKKQTQKVKTQKFLESKFK